jgi:hypothetical protein
MGETEEEAVGVEEGGGEGVMALAEGVEEAQERVEETVEEEEALAAGLPLGDSVALCVTVPLEESERDTE